MMQWLIWNAVSLSCAIGAIVCLVLGIEHGWGWLLFVAICLHTSPSASDDCDCDCDKKGGSE